MKKEFSTEINLLADIIALVIKLSFGSMEVNMKILLTEDDFFSRKYMSRFLSKYGECDVTVDGLEAIEAFNMALESDEGYDLVCLDIIMPKVDGYQALKEIREIEKKKEIPENKCAKIIMTTALSDKSKVKEAFVLGCTAYAGKPIDQKKFEHVLRKMNLLQGELEC